MKRFIIAIGLILILALPASAQVNYFGPTVKVQDARATANTWWNTNPSGTTLSSLELKGYNSVRADYDVTGTDVNITVNFQVSNDSIWVSGDSIEITADSWGVFDLMGGQDYNIYVESVSDGDTITIFMTPYQK